MSQYSERGESIRELSIQLVKHFMEATAACQPGAQGRTQSDLFRDCGFEWPHQQTSDATHQRVWFNFLLQEMERRKIIELNQSPPQSSGKFWRLV